MLRTTRLALWVSLCLFVAIPAFAARTVTLPHVEKFDAPESTYDIADAITGGCRIVYEDGVVRFYPGAAEGQYCGFRNISFPATKVVSLSEKVMVTGQFLDGIDRSLKHHIINRTSYTDPSIDSSGLRGMTYIWRDSTTLVDYSLGACQATECIFDGGGTRPNKSDPANGPIGSFWLRDYVGKWLYVVSVYDTVNHTVKVFVSTQDRVFENSLLATRPLDRPVPASLDSWKNVDTWGLYGDRTYTPNANAYIAFDEIRVTEGTFSAPPDFFADFVAAPPVVYLVAPNPQGLDGTSPLYPDLRAAMARTREIGRVAEGTVCEGGPALTTSRQGERRYVTNACGSRGVALCRRAD